MGLYRKSMGPVRQTQSEAKRTLLHRKRGWHRWLIALGAIGLLGSPSRPASAAPACPDSQPTVSASFNFNEFTGNQPFTLNTCMTTSFGPAWADILVKPENFLQCKGAPIALCYYSGPGPVTPCEFAPDPATASCTCYEVPSGSTYFVDINAILNLDVYVETVNVCGIDGSGCQPRGPKPAPVCDFINKNTLIPGADLISTFSLYLEREIAIGKTQCTVPALYAGCMTAPCTRTGNIDPATGLPLAQCTCPTFDGPYQLGQTVQAGQCVLDNNLAWSAAYAPGGNFPPTPPGCVPDVPGQSGCPLLSPKPPNIPPPPSNISCANVCAEYRNSARGAGIEVGFTCDATLCTAAKADLDLVKEACSGLGETSVAEILKLETEVGFSCAASQICGCEPQPQTNAAIFSLNERQRARGISPQCDLNGTLCGKPLNEIPPGKNQIPTLSGWVMIMLAVFLAVVGAAVVRRKASRVTGP